MSDIQLTRADILQLEPISNTNTMKLLPVGKTKKQKQTNNQRTSKRTTG